MTRRQPSAKYQGFDPVFGEALDEYSAEEELAMRLYLVNLRRGFQICPECGERKRAWSNRLCLSCGGPGGYSDEALARMQPLDTGESEDP